MEAAGPSKELEALLDDALEGFDIAAGASVAGQAAAAAPSTTAAAAAGTAAGGTCTLSGATLEEAWKEATRSCGNAGSSGALPKGLAFDPLARRTRKAGAAAASQTAAAGSGSGAPDVGIHVLSEGLSKLLEELAQAEDAADNQARNGATTAAAGAPSTSQGAGAAEQQQRQQDLNATLRALSEQSPSFASGQEGADSEEAMMRLLAEHLGALGGTASSTSAGWTTAASEGAGSPPGMVSLVDSIMQQLLSKDVLYQPMKDIGEKYPEWLAANKDKLSADEYARYQQQHGYIQRICYLYKTSPSDFSQLVELLQQMQQCGQPPQEIVDELAPGMQFGPDGLPTFGGSEEGLPPELKNCTIQ